jgi:hypothetical protein
VGTRYALLDDAPWRSLTMDDPSAQPPAMEGAEEGMDVEQPPANKIPMSYQDEPLMLDLIGGEERRCKSIPYLMSIDNYEGGESIDIRCRSLDGIIYGRLAIFDAPPSPDDDDDEEDEEEEQKETNPNLQQYTTTYSLIDRFFLADAVRDVLSCHRPMVSDAGAERNTAKEVAEQIWAVSHLFKSPPAGDESANAEGMEGEGPAASSGSDTASKGIEYGIIETILSLIVQTTPTNSSAPPSSPVNSHLYLSRVLLELTKLQPLLVPQAIVLAVSAMFQDFVPSLTPCARENLGSWLGFHLVNTGYQWPKAYWDHWAPYAATTGTNSRGEFIKAALYSMAGMSSDGALSVVKECLPPGSTLVKSVFFSSGNEDEVSSAEKDLVHRLWNTAEDPDNIRTHIISDELSESHGAVEAMDNANNSMYHKSVWWRARLAARALFHPVRREKMRMERITEKAWKEKQRAAGIANENGDNGNDEGMAPDDDIVDETEDLLADMSDAIPRFKPVVLAALARDADAYDSMASGKVDDDALLLAGEVTILNETMEIVSVQDIALTCAMLECLMRNRIVSSMAVARWALTAKHDATSSTDSCDSIHSSWWKLVSLAFRHSIIEACSSFEANKTDLGGGIGMIVDNDGENNNEDAMETAALRLEEALKSTAPILKYVTDQACGILASCNSNKKISPVGADVVGGMKQVILALLFHFHSLVLTPLAGGSSCTLTASNLQKGFASVDADGEKLAAMCQGAHDSCTGEQGKRLLQSLAHSLEKIF